MVDGAVGMAFAEISRVINLQITGGSTAVRMTGRFGMRQVGATARAMLIAAAADRWNVPAASLAVRDGMISDPGNDRSARFGELAQAAARLPAPADVPLKQPRQWRIVGTSLPRLDIPAKTDGSFAYGIDLKLPDMLHAAVTSAPIHGGRLTDVDLSPAQSMPSVALALRLERGVAVVATSWWQARRALEVLEPQFSTGDARVLNKADLQAEQDRVLDFSDGTQVLSAGDPDGAISSAAEGRVIEATYRVPYLHQAAMEPINVTAQFSAGKLSVWGGEQDALGTKVRLMELSGLGGDAVVFHGLAAGGAFGRRTPPSADYLEHLVPIAFAVAPRPVKLILAREEEFAQGAYRPALATKLRAALGADGRPVAWSQDFLAGPTRNDAFSFAYEIPSQSMRSFDFATHIRTGTWRAVAHTQHAFWTESFIDELAHAAGQDPFEYRHALLPVGSRERKVLETAAEKAGWGSPLSAGVGRGIALAESYGTIVAQIVELSLRENGVPRVHRVVAAVDCGTVVHPDTARSQVEGAIVMGLSAALFEEITIEGGAVVEKNFPDYPIIGMSDVPEIEVHFIASDGIWGGLGEPGLPPVAPALCNALFVASGRRVRSLPVMTALRETA